MSSAAMIDTDDGDMPYIVTVQADITARHELEDRLAHEATRDPLTGIYNRGAFLTQLELALARRAFDNMALLFVDLDHFKAVNDSLGHEAGDAVLATIARRILDVVRDGDAVARLGGDEFVVLCHDVTGVDEAAAIAERVRATTDQPVEVRGGLARIGASVGVAIGRPGDHPAALLRAADMAAYAAKRSGRGRVVVDHNDVHPARWTA
jgi:diguanylate cyclase (GGDEF)-like protein